MKEQKGYTLLIFDATGYLAAHPEKVPIRNLDTIRYIPTTLLADKIIEFLPDVVVLRLPDDTAYRETDLIWRLKTLSPRTNFVTIVQTPKEAFRAITQGAIGYTYQQEIATLPQTVRKAAHDHSVFDANVAKLILQHVDNDATIRDEKFLLTHTERHILSALAKEYMPSTIERQLHLPSQSVAYYMGSVALKLAWWFHESNTSLMEDDLVREGVLRPWKDNSNVHITFEKFNALICNVPQDQRQFSLRFRHDSFFAKVRRWLAWNVFGRLVTIITSAFPHHSSSAPTVRVLIGAGDRRYYKDASL